MPYFRVFPATANQVQGTWTLRGSASDTLDALKFNDSKYITVDLGQSIGELNTSVSAATNIILYDDDVPFISNPLGVRPTAAEAANAIDFASLPAGFTITSLYLVVFPAADPGNGSDIYTFQNTVGGQDYGSPYNITWFSGAPSGYSGMEITPTPNAINAFFNQYGVKMTRQAGGNFISNSFGVDIIYLAGSYTLSSYVSDCTDVELEPGIVAQVCTYTQLPDGDTSGDLPDLSGLQWWNLGIYWLYQVQRPGPGWVAGTPDFTGWYRSFEEFAGGSLVIDGDQRPRDPRDYSRLGNYLASAQFAHVGQGLSSVFHNHLIYARKYDTTNEVATLGVFDGLSDRTIASIPPQADGTEIVDIVSVTPTGGAIYVTTLDDGTDGSDWSGRVFRLDPTAGTLTQMGNTFTTGQVPYAVCWYNGRLYCGTNPSDNSHPGKLYSMLPDYDTSWTEVYDIADADPSTGLCGITFLVQFQGNLYFGIGGTDGVSSEISYLKPDGSVTYSTENGDGTAVDGSLYTSAAVFGDNLYVSYWSDDTSSVSTIVKFDGSSWSTVKTFDNDKPVILLRAVGDKLYAVQGGKNTAIGLWFSTDGTTWTDVTDFLPSGTTTVGIPAFEALY